MYQPFLISGFKTAKSIGMEAWLSPPDAFRVLENMIVNKGVLEKRLGFKEFAQMEYGKKPAEALQTDTAITGIHTFLDKSMPCLLIMDSKYTVETVIGEDLNEYRCIATHLSAAATRPAIGVDYLDYWLATGNTGPAETWLTANTYTAGVYTGRCNFYNPVDGTMTDVSSVLAGPVDIFSGSPYDFFSFINWQGVGYMVNNVDQIHKYEGRGTAVVPFDIQIDSGDPAANQINTCRFMFIKDDRIVLLDTVEFGEWQQKRCRYSPVLQTDFSAPGSGYVDAPTQERICTAGYVGRNIAVFTQGADSGTLWLIKSTGNADIPFKWDRITTTELIRSPYSGVELKDGLAAIGATNIVFYDGFKIKDLDVPNLRDILDEFNDVFIRSVFGYRQRDARHLLFTFADKGIVKRINRILDYNIDENNWTIHKSEQSFFINCFGGFTGQKVPTGGEFAGVVATDLAAIPDLRLDARTVFGTPKPYTLIGCRNSKVYKWLNGTDDDDSEIAIKAESIDMNPFVKEGVKVACEKIGFLVDNDSSASFLVSVYKNTSSTAYKTKTISCDGSNDKFWAWIYCDGEIGNFHKINISHTEKANTPKIHAFMPYFESAGALDL